MRYRKKPVVIEAWQFGDWGSLGTSPAWMKGAYIAVVFPDPHLLIETLEGTMRANMGDWIIKGVKGEIYPCKPDIFEATYEAVE